MKRRTLDFIFAGGGLVLAVLLAVVGVFLWNQANFAKDYVRQELAAQKITFAPAANLTDAEKNWKPGSACLVTYAGQPMETGAQAECYAKYYIREHMAASAKTAGFEGATYATLGSTRTDLSSKITAAKNSGNTETAATLQKQYDAATALRSSLQSGETLSGLLLTVYGFSVIGSVAGDAANIVFALAAVLAVIAIAGFVHAFVTPREELVFGRAPGYAPAPA